MALGVRPQAHPAVFDCRSHRRDVAFQRVEFDDQRRSVNVVEYVADLGNRIGVAWCRIAPHRSGVFRDGLRSFDLVPKIGDARRLAQGTPQAGRIHPGSKQSESDHPPDARDIADRTKVAAVAAAGS
jgi:hypothetical protein